MQNKLVESTAYSPLGEPGGHKLLEIAGGQYSERLVALMQTSAGEIKLSFADPPFSSWSSPQTVVSDTSDRVFDCVIESGGDIHLVYSEETTDYLVTRKLSFSGGSWSAESKVTIYSGSQCFEPTIALEPSGRLWVAYASFSAPNRTVYVKSSDDGGANWGSGATDAGTELAGPITNLWAKVLVGLNDVIVVYSADLLKLAMRSRPLSGESWAAEFVISSGSSFSRHFDVAVRSDGLMAVVYDTSGLRYREYDGNSWSPQITIDSAAALHPNVVFRDNMPIVTYLSVFQGTQRIPKYVVKDESGFTSPECLDSRAGLFDSVILYDLSVDSFQDKTSEAASPDSADVYHSDSGCLLKDAGDRILLGMDAPFRYLQFALSTVGIGGTVNYSYWNGTSWSVFTPVSGLSHLDSATERILLWTDYAGIPVDWQKCEFDSTTRFYIKIEVVSSYTSGPVGSQISAVSQHSALVLKR